MLRFETAGSAYLPAQDYLSLSELPPLDRPAALPEGGGAAILNFLACLLSGLGVASARYRGPYTTAHLFDALCRSFAWTASAAGEDAKALTEQREILRTRFSAEEWSAALDAALETWRGPEVDWRPDPWLPLRPHADLFLQWRRGAEVVWVRGRPFTAPGAGETATGGAHVWRIPHGGYEAGLLLLGRPWRTFVRLDEDGRVTAYDPPLVESPSRTVPMPEPWPRVAWDWTTLVATPALAGAIARLEETVTFVWAPWPGSLAEAVVTPMGTQIGIQTGITQQFRTLSEQGQDRGDLALMAVSDAVGGIERVLRRIAQQRLAAQDAPDPAALVTAGKVAQERARERLQRDLPALVAALAKGEAWGV
jgi:hypothetical protein